MERDPKRRYQSAADMKWELDDYEAVELIGRSTRPQAPQIWSRVFAGSRWSSRSLCYRDFFSSCCFFIFEKSERTAVSRCTFLANFARRRVPRVSIPL